MKLICNTRYLLRRAKQSLAAMSLQRMVRGCIIRRALFHYFVNESMCLRYVHKAFDKACEYV